MGRKRVCIGLRVLTMLFTRVWYGYTDREREREREGERERERESEREREREAFLARKAAFLR